MTPEKLYDPQEPVAITMTREQWNMVRSAAQYIADVAHGNATWWRLCCADRKMGGETAIRYEEQAAAAENVVRIIEETLCPKLPKEE